MKHTNDLEAIETRIGILRDDSRYYSHRIESDLQRRKEINNEIQQLKSLAREIKEQPQLEL